MNNEVDPEHRPGRISRKGMGGWKLQIEKYLSILPNIRTQPTLPFSISLENALPTSGRGFLWEKEAHKMRQHTFIVLNILTSASPMLFVTFQRLISFHGEYWPV